MGKRAIPHSDLCGCERCAIQADREHPIQVYDIVEDPDVFDCGCDVHRGCDCEQYNYGDDD